MSTTPGDSTWADAGLVPPDSSAVPGSERSTTPVDPADLPRAPKPDLLAEGDPDVLARHDRGQEGYRAAAALPEDAAEGDALEQAQDQRGDLAGERLPSSAARDDAAEGDVIEQSIEVPDDDADDYRG